MKKEQLLIEILLAKVNKKPFYMVNTRLIELNYNNFCEYTEEFSKQKILGRANIYSGQFTKNNEMYFYFCWGNNSFLSYLDYISDNK